MTQAACAGAFKSGSLNRQTKGAYKAVRLSKRLETVISFVKPGSRVADVGTDHGFVPIELVLRKLAAGAVAMDVRPGPLGRAQEHIRQRGLEGRIETRLGDGVERLGTGEADTVVIAGMGGPLVIHIMEQGRRLWGHVEHWILSPQSELDKVRRFLHRNGFYIAREDMVAEEEKYYTVIDAVFKGNHPQGRKEMTEMEYRYGPRLMEERNQVLLEYLEREKCQLAGIAERLREKTGEKAEARRKELEGQIQRIQMFCQAGLRETQETFDCQGDGLKPETSTALRKFQ